MSFGKWLFLKKKQYHKTMLQYQNGPTQHTSSLDQKISKWVSYCKHIHITLEKKAVKKVLIRLSAKLLPERRLGTIVTDKATNMKKAFATHYTTAKATTGVSCGENLPEVMK